MMAARLLILGTFLALLTGSAYAQTRRAPSSYAVKQAAAAEEQPSAEAPADADPQGNIKWRTPAAGRPGAEPAAVPLDGQPPLRPVTPSGSSSTSAGRTSIARVSRGPATLPNDAGQEWRDYDITPYTTRVTSTNTPERAILDWILRETGYEVWHTQPIALLSVDNRRVSVYHTPEMHAVVSEVIDRFVNTEAESHAFGMRVITIGNPNWRAKAHRMLHPVAAQTQGIQAWLLAKEDAALLVAELRRRNDFLEHSTPHLLVNNGQSKQISAIRPRNYVKDALLKSDAWPGFEPQMGQYDEGFKLEFSPLLSIDGRVVDAVIHCEVDQIEKMIPVMIDVPTTVAPRQRQKIEVPQPISTRLHERFRWPEDQVLLISLGVGPAPVPVGANPLGVTVPLISPASRSDLLVFVESRGKVSVQASASQPGQRAAGNYHSRY